MNKAVIGTVGGLALGVASGYFVADMRGESKENKSITQSIMSQQAPRFGKTVSESSSAATSSEKKAKADIADIMKERSMPRKLAQLMDYYSNLSPEELALEARKLSSMRGEDRMMASSILFTKWAESSPKQAMEYANKLGPMARGEKSIILQTWSSMNPEAATSYYMDNKNSMDGRSAGIIAGEWARMNPDAALSWANSLNSAEKGGALRSAFSAYAESNPALAAQKASLLSAEDLAGSRVLESIANQWAKQDWAATETWLNGLPAEQQDSARREAIEGLATVNPTLAAEQVAKLPEGNDKEAAVASVARAMAIDNPALAADLMAKNSSGNNMGTQFALGQVMGSWVYTDTEAAKNWAASLPDGNTKSAAIISYAMQTPSKDYAGTIDLASSITNDRMKEAAIGAAVRNWMKEDPDAAQNWVDSSNLSDRAKQSITDPGQIMRALRGRGNNPDGRGPGGGGPGGGRGQGRGGR